MLILHIYTRPVPPVILSSPPSPAGLGKPTRHSQTTSAFPRALGLSPVHRNSASSGLTRWQTTTGRVRPRHFVKQCQQSGEYLEVLLGAYCRRCSPRFSPTELRRWQMGHHCRAFQLAARAGPGRAFAQVRRAFVHQYSVPNSGPSPVCAHGESDGLLSSDFSGTRRVFCGVPAWRRGRETVVARLPRGRVGFPCVGEWTTGGV